MKTKYDAPWPIHWNEVDILKDIYKKIENLEKTLKQHNISLCVTHQFVTHKEKEKDVWYPICQLCGYEPHGDKND